MDNAFRYVEKFPLMTEKEYPYTAKTGKVCKYKADEGVGKVKTFKDVKPDSVEALKAAVAMTPTSVAVEADKDVF